MTEVTAQSGPAQRVNWQGLVRNVKTASLRFHEIAPRVTISVMAPDVSPDITAMLKGADVALRGAGDEVTESAIARMVRVEHAEQLAAAIVESASRHPMAGHRNNPYYGMQEALQNAVVNRHLTVNDALTAVLRRALVYVLASRLIDDGVITQPPIDGMVAPSAEELTPGNGAMMDIYQLLRRTPQRVLMTPAELQLCMTVWRKVVQEGFIGAAENLKPVGTLIILKASQENPGQTFDPVSLRKLLKRGSRPFNMNSAILAGSILEMVEPADVLRILGNPKLLVDPDGFDKPPPPGYH